jgi:hypothetical protein
LRSEYGLRKAESATLNVCISELEALASRAPAAAKEE